MIGFDDVRSVRVYAQGIVRLIEGPSPYVVMNTACHVVHMLERNSISYRVKVNA